MESYTCDVDGGGQGGQPGFGKRRRRKGGPCPYPYIRDNLGTVLRNGTSQMGAGGVRVLTLTLPGAGWRLGANKTGRFSFRGTPLGPPFKLRPHSRHS